MQMLNGSSCFGLGLNEVFALLNPLLPQAQSSWACNDASSCVLPVTALLAQLQRICKSIFKILCCLFRIPIWLTFDVKLRVATATRHFIVFLYCPRSVSLLDSHRYVHRMSKRGEVNFGNSPQKTLKVEKEEKEEWQKTSTRNEANFAANTSCTHCATGDLILGIFSCFSPFVSLPLKIHNPSTIFTKG